MFKPKSLESILASFHRTMDHLKDLLDSHGEMIVEKNKYIHDLNQEIAGHEAEKAGAERVLSNLEKIVKGDL